MTSSAHFSQSVTISVLVTSWVSTRVGHGLRCLSFWVGEVVPYSIIPDQRRSPRVCLPDYKSYPEVYLWVSILGWRRPQFSPVPEVPHIPTSIEYSLWTRYCRLRSGVVTLLVTPTVRPVITEVMRCPDSRTTSVGLFLSQPFPSRSCNSVYKDRIYMIARFERGECV